MKIAERAIAAALAPLRFQMQSDPNSVNFVRRNAATAHLFEWVECVYVGRPPHTIVLSVALSAVQHGVLQFRGLLARDGWPEMCTDPENGRVAFQRREEVAEWLARLADQAPERFERLVREKGDTFLAITKEARERVGVVADTIVPRRALADAVARTIRRPHGRGDEIGESLDAASTGGGVFGGTVERARRGNSGTDSFWG